MSDLNDLQGEPMKGNKSRNSMAKAQTMKNVFASSSLAANSSKRKNEIQTNDNTLNVIDESKDEEVPRDKFGATPALRE